MRCQSMRGFFISIHAPPRGATQRRNQGRRQADYFNSRPSARGDGNPRRAEAWTRQFQFTPLREGRRRGRLSGQRRGYFNSRPSARGDGFVAFLLRGGLISIHAPPRGATRPDQKNPAASRFQFTPLREGRPTIELKGCGRLIFQFTPLREGRPQKICNFCKSFVQPLQISMA